MKKRSKGQIIYSIVLLVILTAGLMITIISLAAFRYVGTQLDDVILEDITRQTGQSADTVTITKVTEKDIDNIQVIMLQLDNKGGLATGFAVFTKLPLISLYRFDGLFWPSNNYEFARVIQTGFTEELIYAAGSEITVTNSGLGTIPRVLGLFVVLVFVQTIILKAYEYDKKAKKLAEQESSKDVI